MLHLASCNQVHALNADARPYQRRYYPTLGATGAETLLLLSA